MGRLLYFVDGVQSVDRAKLDEVGIGATIQDAKFAARGATTGPGGNPGVTVGTIAVGRNGREKHIGYFPEKQEWEKAKSGDYWIGKFIEDPPRPEDLLRKEAIDGHNVELFDGNRWIIPIARKIPIGSVLPRAMVLGPNGELVMEALPRYTKLSKMTERIWDSWSADARRAMVDEEEVESDDPITVEFGWEIAIEALGLNYLVGPEEISFLRLITTANIKMILGALIDLPTMIEVGAAHMEEATSKKNDANTLDGSSINSGEPVGSSDILQRSPTSSGSTKDN